MHISFVWYLARKRFIALAVMASWVGVVVDQPASGATPVIAASNGSTLSVELITTAVPRQSLCQFTGGRFDFYEQIMAAIADQKVRYAASYGMQKAYCSAASAQHRYNGRLVAIGLGRRHIRLYSITHKIAPVYYSSKAKGNPPYPPTQVGAPVRI